jgi:hypothetical protein
MHWGRLIFQLPKRSGIVLALEGLALGWYRLLMDWLSCLLLGVLLEVGAEGLFILFYYDVVDFVAVWVLEFKGGRAVIEELK